MNTGKGRHCFWMALCKPRKSHCWLPMQDRYGLGVVIGYWRQACIDRARKTLTQEWLDTWAPANKFRTPAEWHVKAVKVNT